MPTRDVVLTDHHAHFVEKRAFTGRCQNASEVLRYGLRLVEAREAQDSVRLHAPREAARIGMADSLALTSIQPGVTRLVAILVSKPSMRCASPSICA